MKTKQRMKVKRSRNYGKKLPMGWLWLMLALFAAVFIFSAFKIGEYTGSYLASRKVSRDLQQENRQVQITPVPTEELNTPSPLPAAEKTPSPTALPAEKRMLPDVKYPLNSFAQVRERFRKLQQTNKDIVGWLSIQGVVDEAVVQRDNQYYLRRDYKGYHNQNGAIFMDEKCQLKTRPYTIILYGHNMKNGAMLGFVNHYERLRYYQYHPFVTFDSAYEDGEYVIFSVASISTREYDADYLDLGKLQVKTVAWRQEAIDELRRRSLYNTSRIPVSPEDQILLLVTCAEENADRKVIAARRIRPEESKDALMEAVQRANVK